MFASFQPLAAIATTADAARRLQPLCQSTGATLWLPASVSCVENAQYYSGSLKEHLATLWEHHRAFIFCLAVGAVVRAIAPLLKDKSCDPAVVVIDLQGKFAISLCSGHQGGADRLAQLIARQIGATPVLTGASASLGLPSLDGLGVPFGWRRGHGDWTGVSAALARGEGIQVTQEAGSLLWQATLPDGHHFVLTDPLADCQQGSPSARLYISARQRQMPPNADFSQVQWHPRVLWVGIGCVRGTSAQAITRAIEQVCQRYDLAPAAIAGIATIELKADEAGLLAFCQAQELPLKIFTAEVLRAIAVPNPSAVVEEEVGTPSVAEAAALAAANRHSRENAALQDSSQTSILLVPKEIIKDESSAVTVAIAQAPIEYTGRTRQLYLVGTGPGALEQMTPAAQTAVTQADAVIGYSLYLDLIKPLQRPGQMVEALAITQERQRAQRAIALAQWGLTVAVVSSGDCGIYGMAGLVLEELRSLGWDGKTPKIEVFPGISALQAAAARVGAPLMHDFCAISLSDLLTPWQVIQKRLEAAAIGDFVTALYNPRSQQRSQQILNAQQIFLTHRDPDTPVAIVRSAYRPDEHIMLTTLEQMLQFPIDMLTIILIGNSSTRHYNNWMITPRGYLE